jgi:hypothetical protein
MIFIGNESFKTDIKEILSFSLRCAIPEVIPEQEIAQKAGC